MKVDGVSLKIKLENLQGKFSFSIESEKYLLTSIDLLLTENKTGRKLNFTFPLSQKSVCGNFNIDNPSLWSIESPNLYNFTATIYHSGGKTELTGKFGARIISTDKKNVLLNGKKVFIKGYIRGARAHEHLNNGNLSEYDFYRKNILQAKKYGFNYIRFHTTIPPKELFDVADELGILIHIELRASEYDNLNEMSFGKVSLVDDEFILGVIDRLYDHPSLAVYCIGNELKSLVHPERIEQIGELIKKADPSRLFLDTCAWGEIGRKNIDIDVQHMSYYFPFNKHSKMFDDLHFMHMLTDEQVKKDDKLFSVPLIAHEVCHYTALRDFNGLKEKFIANGTEVPWWIDEELKMIESKGLSENYDQLYKASKLFQFECWKTAFEEIRTSRLLDGFHFLQFADTDKYENSNGVVDCFDDDTFFSAKDFLTFNGDIVLVIKMPKRNFSSGDIVDFPVYLSNFGEDNFTTGKINYTLKDIDGKTVYESEKIIDLNKGMNKIDNLRFALPTLISANRYILETFIEYANEKIAFNTYKLWLYPKYKAQSYEQFCNYEKKNSVITDDIEKALYSVEKGKNVCLIYRQQWTRHLKNQNMQPPKLSFKATWNRFKPVIWDRGTNFGGLCENELLSKYGLNTDKYYDFNYAITSDDCDKIILDDFPVAVESLISGTDKNNRDRFDASPIFDLHEFEYDRTMRKFSYMFQLKVGSGNLLVCGLNLTGIDNNEPSNMNVADFIIKYINSENFNPKNQISLSELKDYMKDCALSPVKERMMTQFWQLDEEPVETEKYWEDSEKYLKN